MDPILQALVAAAALAIPVVIGAAAKFFKAWTDAQISKIGSEKHQVRVSMARDAVGDAVYSISQTMVGEIRAAAADGKIDAKERENLRQTALDTTMSAFSTQFWTELASDMDLDSEDLKQWLLSLIEAKVFSMNNK